MAAFMAAIVLCVYLYWPEDGRDQSGAGPRMRGAAARPAPAPNEAARILRFMQAVPADADAGRFIVTLGGEAEYGAFVADAGEAGLEIAGTIPQVGAVLVGVKTDAQREALAGLVPALSAIHYNFQTFQPDLAEAHMQEGLVSFGAYPGQSVGCPFNLDRGKGVSVALIDSRVSPHPALAQARIVSFEAGASAGDGGWHGTAMASIICGRSDFVRGAAPGVVLSNYAVVGPGGAGECFTLAASIVMAVDAGNSIVCIQPACTESSEVLALAAAYATERGSLLVAPAGESGALLYPAAIDGVMGVGAVDEAGRTIGLAMKGAAILAPGMGIPVAAPGGEEALVDGSGSAAAFVAGALAGIVYEEPGLGVFAARDLLLSYAAKTGLSGSREVGRLDVGRIRSRTHNGLRDVAVTGIEARPSGTGMHVRVAVCNKGTANTAFNLEVVVGGVAYHFSSQGLGANAYQVFEFDSTSSGPVWAQVDALAQDADTSNDSMSL
jgi:hypothetical protein